MLTSAPCEGPAAALPDREPRCVRLRRSAIRRSGWRAALAVELGDEQVDEFVVARSPLAKCLVGRIGIPGLVAH